MQLANKSPHLLCQKTYTHNNDLCTYIRTYIHTVHTMCIHAVLTHVNTYACAYLHTCMYTYEAYITTYVCVHMYICTHECAYV